jgi:hypothetical protein
MFGSVLPTISTTTVRSGLASASCASGTGFSSEVRASVILVASTTYYGRVYVNINRLPNATVAILHLGGIGASGVAIRITSGGILQLWDVQNAAQIGSLAGSALVLDSWYMLELSLTVDASIQASAAAARLEGTQFASGSITTTSALITSLTAGWNTSPGANRTMFLDDIAVNDSTGTEQNYFPGHGKVVLLTPTADSAVGAGWTLGTGTATGGNAFAAVKNTPPLGVADLTAGSDNKQIRNASANADVSYDATMKTYAAAGITDHDVINVLEPIVATAAPSVTSAKAGTVGVVSNPAIADVALGAGGTAGAFWAGTAAAAYNSTASWKWSKGTITHAPSVTLGTAPVMRVTQVTSSTFIAMVCFMGIYVDYTPKILPRPMAEDSEMGLL